MINMHWLGHVMTSASRPLIMSISSTPTSNTINSVSGQMVTNRTDGLCNRLVLPQHGYECTEYMVTFFILLVLVKMKTKVL